MKIQEFVNMEKFEEIIANWRVATGLVAGVVDMEGNYLSKCDNFTDFWSKQTEDADEGIDLIVKEEKVGSVIGGQITADEADMNNVKSEEAVQASVNLLGEVLNYFINAEYNAKYNDILERLTSGVTECERLVQEIQQNTAELNRIQQRQNILALNASIEAARAGDVGKGFAVVAKEVGILSVESRQLNEQISKNIDSISHVVHDMTGGDSLK